MIKKNDVKMIDFRFTDLPGQWQHFSVPVNQFNEKSFEEGLGFDGSSIRGWQSIHESDMLIFPGPGNSHYRPVHGDIKILSMICDIFSPITKQAIQPRPEIYCKESC